MWQKIAFGILLLVMLSTVHAEQKWQFNLEKLTVAKVKADGKAWDISGNAPDIFIATYKKSDRQWKPVFTSQVFKDRYEATNINTKIVVTGAIELRIEVWDKDIGRHDKIGDYVLSLTDAEILASQDKAVSIAFGSVTEFTYSFKKFQTLEDREAEVQKLEASLEAREQNLRQQEEEFELKQEQLQKQMEEFHAKVAELEQRVQELETAKQNLAQKEAELSQKETELTQKEQKLLEQEQDLGIAQEQLEAQQKLLQEKVNQMQGTDKQGQETDKQDKTSAVEPKPEEPKPEEPTAVEPTPEEPTAVEPVEPKPEEPIAVEPKPEDLFIAAPKPVEPAPSMEAFLTVQPSVTPLSAAIAKAQEQPMTETQAQVKKEFEQEISSTRRELYRDIERIPTIRRYLSWYRQIVEE